MKEAGEQTRHEQTAPGLGGPNDEEARAGAGERNDEEARTAMNAAGWCRRALWLVPAVVFATAVREVLTVPRLESAGTGNAEARARVVTAVRAAEPGFRREAFEHFPADPWSRGDDFSAKERGLVKRLAGEEKMRIGAVLDVIDRDVKFAKHETPDLPDRGRVAPCMPRPFYD